MRYRSTATWLLAAWSLAAPLSASAQVFTGRVVDADTGEDLVGVELVVLSEDGVPRVRGFTDTSGRFLIDLDQAGEYLLRVRHLGFATYTSGALFVDRNQAAEVQIRLGVEAIPLEPIAVVARRSAEEAHLAPFHERRLNPGRVGGYFMTREEIEKRPNATPSQLLLSVPGVTLQRVNNAGAFVMDRSVIRLSGGSSGGCHANVYVDGAPVQQSAQHSVDDLLDHSLVAGVEVYPRSSTAPIEYQMHQDCGVVLYWTRRPGAGRRPPSFIRDIMGGVVVVGLFAWAFVGIIGS